MPTSQQVIPGAAVSIVLKADQPTGLEVQGIVKDLLSRGDHPKGIKVRLQDGRIGRVQRMATGNVEATIGQRSTSRPARTQNSETRVRKQQNVVENPELPPSRTLADFITAFGGDDVPARPGVQSEGSYPTAKCPICGLFEGDEAAVSHHVQEHLD